MFVFLHPNLQIHRLIDHALRAAYPTASGCRVYNEVSTRTDRVWKLRYRDSTLGNVESR